MGTRAAILLLGAAGAGWWVFAALGCGRAPNDAERSESPGAAAQPLSAPDRPSAGAERSPSERTEPAAATACAMSAACARLLPFLPNVFEGYRAKGPAEGGEIDLGHDSAVRVARRGYSKRSTALELEIVDTQRAAPLRELFARTRRVEQAGDDAVFKALRVQGHDAFAQWNSTSKATRVSLLVGTRYLVNLSLRPTAELDTSLVLAEQLNLHALARLALDSPIASH